MQDMLIFKFAVEGWCMWLQWLLKGGAHCANSLWESLDYGDLLYLGMWAWWTHIKIKIQLYFCYWTDSYHSPPITTGFQESSKIPTGFQQIFPERYFHIFFDSPSSLTTNGLQLDLIKANTLLQILDSYWCSSVLNSEWMIHGEIVQCFRGVDFSHIALYHSVFVPSIDL